MTTVILLRHGESEANINGTIAGQMDVDLTEKGFLQAELASKYIVENYKIDKIYSSDLKRAYKTACAIAEKLDMPIEKSVNLREICAGIWEGQKYTDISVKYAEDYRVWIDDVGRSRPTDGESAKELGVRIMAELNRIADENEGKTAFAVTHATAIRAAATIIELGEIERMKELYFVANASVNIFVRENGKWRVEAMNIDKYLAGMKTDFPVMP